MESPPTGSYRVELWANGMLWFGVVNWLDNEGTARIERIEAVSGLEALDSVRAIFERKPPRPSHDLADGKALDTITSLLNDPDDFTVEWVVLQIVAILKTTGRTVDFGASRDEWIKQHSEPAEAGGISPDELLRRRKESEDWAVREYPATADPDSDQPADDEPVLPPIGRPAGLAPPEAPHGFVESTNVYEKASGLCGICVQPKDSPYHAVPE